MAVQEVQPPCCLLSYAILLSARLCRTEAIANGDYPGALGDKPGALGDKPGALGDKPLVKSIHLFDATAQTNILLCRLRLRLRINRHAMP